MAIGEEAGTTDRSEGSCTLLSMRKVAENVFMAEESKPTIMAEENGPLYIQSAKGLMLLDSDGNPFEITDDEITLCRCGQSRNKPFCDDSHVLMKITPSEVSSAYNRLSFDPTAMIVVLKRVLARTPQAQARKHL
jgi:CDGSH-type Zn-finger protein